MTSKAERDKVFIDVSTALRAIFDVVQLQTILSTIAAELTLGVVPLQYALPNVVWDLETTLAINVISAVLRHLGCASPVQAGT